VDKNSFLEWLRSIEAKWQKRWREEKVFEPRIDPDKPKYFITVPYPYSNAPLHIGHGRTYTIGDIIARYKRLRGYNVLFPMAFHITGTPIVATILTKLTIL
jgi:leucyl-tRNA synthetase